MALNSAAPLAQLVTILTALVGVQRVYTGVPEVPSVRMFAYATHGDFRPRDKASSGLLLFELDYFIGLGYVVEGAEDTAETTLGSIRDALVLALYAARRDTPSPLNGTVDNMPEGFLKSLASDPRYQVTAGQEWRIYPIVVTVTQSANY